MAHVEDGLQLHGSLRMMSLRTVAELGHPTFFFQNFYLMILSRDVEIGSGDFEITFSGARDPEILSAILRLLSRDPDFVF